MPRQTVSPGTARDRGGGHPDGARSSKTRLPARCRRSARRDTVLARRSSPATATVNDLQRSIRNRCISVMALQAPVARDLRELITVQLVINELERMGDHAVGIAKQIAAMREYEPHPIVGELTRDGRTGARASHAWHSGVHRRERAAGARHLRARTTRSTTLSRDLHRADSHACRTTRRMCLPARACSSSPTISSASATA